MLMCSGTSTGQRCSSFNSTPRTTSICSSTPLKTPNRLLRRHVPRTPRSSRHRRHPLRPHGNPQYQESSDEQGFEGQYIRFHPDKYNHQNEADRLAGAKFKIAPGLDPSLRDLTTKIIKIATWYGSVSEFVNVHSKPDYGVVNHALCAAIRKLLRVQPPLGRID